MELFCLVSSASILVCLQVCQGLTRSLTLPLWVYSRAVLATHPSGPLTAWPINFVLLSAPQSATALLVSIALHFWLFWASQSSGCSLGTCLCSPETKSFSWNFSSFFQSHAISKFLHHKRALTIWLKISQVCPINFVSVVDHYGAWMSSSVSSF